MRLALGGLLAIVVALWPGAARSQDDAAQEKIAHLNLEALADADSLAWDSAKRRLLEALVIAKKGGLETHPITARTYVRLGIVYITGFKNRERAAQSFLRALEIQPDVRLSPSAATPEVEDVFTEALARRARRPVGGALDCPVTEQTRVDQAVPVRCALAGNLPVTKVFVFYRDPARQRFTEAEMKRTADGSFQGRIPARVIYGPSLQLYFEGRDADGKPIVRNGEAQSPNVVIIVKR
jgi:tetratricopeptide (TPR) repeat protein